MIIRNDATPWEPVETSARYHALDLLRGLALFGVLLVNLLTFFRVSLFAHMLNFHSHPGWANHAVDRLVAAALEFKAFDLFSLTFGVGVAVQAERASSRGIPAEVFLARRFLVLLVFGVGHLTLVSNVDILTLYAVCGLLLIPLLRMPLAALAIGGFAAVYLPSIFHGWPPFPPTGILREHAANATRVYGDGSFGAILAFRWQETQRFIAPLLVGVAQKTFGLMLVGVAAWRSGIVREPQRHRDALRVVCLGAGIVGVLNTLAERGSRAVLPILEPLGSHLPLAFAYAAGLLLWPSSATSTKLTAPVATMGRMALSNYLSQSLVFALLFYGYGFGLFGRLAPAPAAAIGVALYAAQLALSAWWLRRHRFGPFEWLWRSLTYGRRQPMRLSPPVTAASRASGSVPGRLE